MSWGRVNDPSEVLQVGQAVEVFVSRLDREHRKVGLSLRHLLASPWEKIAGNYPPRSLANGTVTRLAEFGAFVELEPGVEGLIHVSELRAAACLQCRQSSSLRRRGPARTGARTSAVAAEIAGRRWRDEPFADDGTEEFIDPRTFAIALDDLFPSERTVVTDSGHFLGYPSIYLSVPDVHGFVFPNAFQSVGLGLGCAIGAADRPARAAVRRRPGGRRRDHGQRRPRDRGALQLRC